jgi:hypothetical protein
MRRILALGLALAVGSAWAQSRTAGGQLEKCTETLGTVAVVEDQNASWHRQMQQYQVQSTVPLLRMLIQESNCFVVVERGQAMRVMKQERALEQSGEMRQGSDFGKGQIVAADYAMNPSITFSSRDSGGIGAAVGGLTSKLGLPSSLGAVAGGLKFREAATMLTLIDNRSGVQLAAAEGNSSKTDFNAWGSVFGGGAGAGGGGYTKTPEGKVIAASFADAYNNLVKAARNYKAQEVKGGLGTGGRLGVQGGRTPASKALDK